MGVPGPVGQRSFRIELALRGAQPAQPDRHARIVGADEGDLLAVGIEQPQHQKEVGIGGFRRHPKLGRDRAGDLEALCQRRRAEGQAVASRLVANSRPRPAPRRQRQPVRLQIIFGPLRALERPFAFARAARIFRPDGGY